MTATFFPRVVPSTGFHNGSGNPIGTPLIRSHRLATPIGSRWSLCGVVMSVFLWVGMPAGFAAEEDAVKGWSFLAVDQTPTTSQFFEEGIALSLQGVNNSKIVDASSPASNPFPNIERAFFVNQSTESEKLRISFRPFPGRVVTEGSLAFDFMIMEGTITANVGITNQPWTAESSNVYTTRFFPLRLAPRQAIRINDQSVYRTENIPAISANQNYRFRIDWSVTDSSGEFRFFLNGSPVLDESGNPYVARVQRMDFEAGELVIGITSNFTGFLGSIRTKETSE